MKPRIAIIGRGNVAHHLVKAFSQKAETRIINPHTLAELDYTPDICLIAVSDTAIPDVARQLSDIDCIVAHTSGTTDIDVLRKAGVKRPGVFYPLQTFSKDVPLQYNEIPVFIEGDTPDIEWILTDIAGIFTTNTSKADSSVRRRLHIASVFACNFVNHLWTIADDTLTTDGFSLEVLHPLLKETLRKAIANGPAQSQTGPAQRNDRLTIGRHLEMLADRPELQKIYQHLTDSIIQHRLEI